MRKLNTKFTFGYLKSAKHRQRSAITSRYVSKTQEINLSISNTITKRNKILLVVPSMEYWHKAFLPEWVQRIGYSSKTSVPFLLGKHGGIPISHLGKSRLKFFQTANASFKVATNGSTFGTWADPQQAPPLNFILEVTSSYRYGTN